MNKMVGCFAIMLCGSFMAFNAAAAEEIVPSLNVQGKASIKIPADQVQFRVGVESQAKTADKALDENSRKMNKVLDALKRSGLVDDEFQTGRFALNPQWSSRPKNAPSNWISKIVGYRASNDVIIKTGQFDKVGDWIAVATEKGANNSGQLSFSLKDPDEHRQQAIRKATLRAKSYAEEAAGAASVSLERVIAMSVNNAGYQPIIHRKAKAERMVMSMSADSVASPAINPGDITVSASVSMTYEIR